MNTRTLEYILTVYETQSFITAADKCFVSQPALSMQIKKFEEYLGTQIFERNTRNIIPTKIGEKIIKQAYKITEEVKSLTKLVDIHLEGGKFNVKIGAFPTLCPYLMPKILPSIKKNIPNLSISIIEEKTNILIDMLEQGKIDFAFLAAPIENKQFIHKHVFKDKFYLAICSENDLAKQKKVSNEEILNQNLMLLEEGHCLRDQALSFCSINNISYNDFKASSLETLRQMVSINEGVTFIPELACNKTANVKYLDIKGSGYYRDICLVMRKSSVYEKLFDELVDIVTKKCN